MIVRSVALTRLYYVCISGAQLIQQDKIEYMWSLSFWIPRSPNILQVKIYSIYCSKFNFNQAYKQHRYRIHCRYFRKVWEIHKFRWFSQSLRADIRIVPQIRPRPLPSTSSQIHYSLPNHATLYVFSYWLSLFLIGARGSVVGWGTMLQVERSRVRVPMRWISHPTSSTMALGSTQPLTEMSTGNLLGG
jgi:hypothetical protein